MNAKKKTLACLFVNKTKKNKSKNLSIALFCTICNSRRPKRRTPFGPRPMGGEISRRPELRAPPLAGRVEGVTFKLAP